jgi:hypothetical protein
VIIRESTPLHNPKGVENNQGIRITYEIKDLAQLLAVV